ncbi:MAG: hypothetical protein AAGK97_09265 [Bacteroidota bacterium]
MVSNKNSLILGLAIGICLPIALYGILLVLYDAGISMLDASGYSSDFRGRTLTLIALCSNLLAVRYFRKQRADNSIRGIVIATSIFAIAWIWIFGRVMIGI